MWIRFALPSFRRYLPPLHPSRIPALALLLVLLGLGSESAVGPVFLLVMCTRELHITILIEK